MCQQRIKVLTTFINHSCQSDNLRSCTHDDQQLQLPIILKFSHNSFSYVPQRSASRRVTLATEGTQEIKEIAEIMAAHDNLNDILQKRKISFISFISAGKYNIFICANYTKLGIPFNSFWIYVSEAIFSFVSSRFRIFVLFELNSSINARFTSPSLKYLS